MNDIFSRWCPACTAWKSALESVHQHKQHIQWGKMDSKEWPVSYMKIAEVFLRAGICIEIKDLSTTLNILKNCTEVPVNVAKKASSLREWRNKVAHLPDTRLSEADKDDIFSQINSTLSEPDIKRRIDNFQELYETLDFLKNNQLFALDEKDSKLVDEVIKAVEESRNEIIRARNCYVLVSVLVLVISVLTVFRKDGLVLLTNWTSEPLKRQPYHQPTYEKNYTGK